MNTIQKKIIYINVMILIMLLAGITMGLIGMLINMTIIHTIILESIAAPMVIGSISMLSLELKHYLNIRHTQVKGGNNDKK